MSLMLGLAGAVCGTLCAVTAIAFERRQRSRVGEPTDVRSLVGFERGALTSGSVERELLTDAAALSFVIGVGALMAYGIVGALADWPHPSAAILCALSGALFGVMCALLGRRRQWT
jgi:membrane associated rhomboid family serine protease